MPEVKSERLSEWVERWGESQWNSAEWRDFLLRCLRDWEVAEDRLSEIEPIYEKQIKYIATLERQIELLQKTLDLAEKFAPRPISIPESGEGVK